MRDGKAVTPYFFQKNLKLLLKAGGLDKEKFSAHSLRIGAASFWASLGLSEDVIKTLGRWTTDAVKRYIRCEVDHTVL